MAFQGGLSIGLSDVKIPDSKDGLILQAKDEVEAVHQNYQMGLITDNERYNQVIDIWTRINSQITETLMKQLEADQQRAEYKIAVDVAPHGLDEHTADELLPGRRQLRGLVRAGHAAWHLQPPCR